MNITELIAQREQVNKLMKRCQTGVGGREALNEAHSIMAECYGVLGKLMSQLEAADALEAAQPEFTGLPKRKLDDLLAQGYKINGVSFQREQDGGTWARGFITTGGMVGWWHGESEPAPQAQFILAKHQPCGCIICSCEDDQQCHGCGAKHCGGHPVGIFASPVYAAPQVPMTGEERGFALMENLGPAALNLGKMSLIQAFAHGLDAAEAHHKIGVKP